MVTQGNSPPGSGTGKAELSPFPEKGVDKSQKRTRSSVHTTNQMGMNGSWPGRKSADAAGRGPPIVQIQKVGVTGMVIGYLQPAGEASICLLNPDPLHMHKEWLRTYHDGGLWRIWRDSRKPELVSC